MKSAEKLHSQDSSASAGIFFFHTFFAFVNFDVEGATSVLTQKAQLGVSG